MLFETVSWLVGLSGCLFVEREKFWGLIARLGPDHDVDALRASLATQSGQEIFSFWDHLVACVSALNTEEYFDQAPVDVGDDPADPLPLGDDAFLDVRIAVVAHGREIYEAVLTNPSRFGTVWPFELGEVLIAAVSEAIEESTGEPWPSLNPDTATPIRDFRVVGGTTGCPCTCWAPPPHEQPHTTRASPTTHT